MWTRILQTRQYHMIADDISTILIVRLDELRELRLPVHVVEHDDLVVVSDLSLTGPEKISIPRYYT